MPVLSNQRHEAFAQGLAKGLSATEAYEAAGFQPNRGNATRLKANESIVARVAELQTKGAEAAEVTVERVVRELARIGFADIRKAVSWSGTTVSLMDSGNLDSEVAAAISEVSRGKDGVRIKFHDKRAALVDIGRYLGMFKDKVEVAGKDGGPIDVASADPRELAKALLSALYGAPDPTGAAGD